MDAVFGDGYGVDAYEMDQIKYSWNYIVENIDEVRIPRPYLILGEGKIDSLSKDEVIRKLKIRANIAYNPASTDIYQNMIAYFDENEERLWIVSLIKMSLILKEYDVAKKLIEMRYPIDNLTSEMQAKKVICEAASSFYSENDYLYTLDYFWDSRKYNKHPFINVKADNPLYDKSSFEDKTKIYDVKKSVRIFDLLVDDGKIPDELAARLLMEDIGNADKYNISYLISDDYKFSRPSAKRIMKLFEFCPSDKFENNIKRMSLSDEFHMYGISMRNSEFAPFGSDLVRLSQKEKNRLISNTKFILQLQLDIIRFYIRENRLSDLNNYIEAIYVSPQTSKDFETIVNDYIIADICVEQARSLIAQRKKLVELCINYESAFGRLIMEMITELGCFEHIVEDYKDKNIDCINRNKLDELSTLMKTYKHYISEIIPINYSAQKGMSYLCRQSAAIPISFNYWYENFYRYLYAIRNLADVMRCPLELKHSTKLIKLFSQIIDRVNCGLLFSEEWKKGKFIREFVETLSCIYWIEGKPEELRSVSRNYEKLIENIVRANDEELMELCLLNNLISQNSISKLLEICFEEELHRSIPVIMALKGNVKKPDIFG